MDYISDTDQANRMIAILKRENRIHVIGKSTWMIIALVEFAVIFGTALALWWIS